MTVLRRTVREAFSGYQTVAALVVGKGWEGRRDTKWAASDLVAPGAPPHPVINHTSCSSVLSIRSHSILIAVRFIVHSGRRRRRLLSWTVNEKQIS